jgi:hypothetical protein
LKAIKNSNHPCVLTDACRAVAIQRQFARRALRESLFCHATKRIKLVNDYYSYDTSFLCHGLLFGRQHLGGGALVAALAGMLGAGVAAVHVQPWEELILMRVFGARVAQSIACAMRADTRRMLQFPPVCASFMEALQVRIGG